VRFVLRPHVQRTSFLSMLPGEAPLSFFRGTA